MYSHQELKSYHIIRGKSNMQECLKFPILVDLIINLFDLNEEVSLSLGIMVYDAPKTNVNKVLYYYVLYTWYV